MNAEELDLPYNWEPRDQQIPLMNAWLHDGVKLMDIIWHRRYGKDDCGTHGTNYMAHERIANYCIMLPQEKQVREALWEAINPHTGIKRLEEAFPLILREKTNEQQMRITLKCGSKIVFAGSDNYKSKIGSSLAGIVYSEWGLSDPASYVYLMPMLKENNGWCLRQGTPRGKNHAYKTYLSGLEDPNRFSQLLTVNDTGADKTLDLIEIKQELIDLYDDTELGTAIFQQEYYCSFDAAVFGSVWGERLAKLEKRGRFTDVPHNPKYKVSTAWDIGHSDSTAIWFFQVIGNQVNIIDYEEASLKSPDYYASKVLGRKVSIDLIDEEVKVRHGDKIKGLKKRRKYKYEKHHLPHDAKQKHFAAKGKSIQLQLRAAFGPNMTKIAKSLSVVDGINMVRQMLKITSFDKSTLDGFEAIKQYKYNYDDSKKAFSIKPVHDWTSHPADALRYLAIAYKTIAKPAKKKKFKHVDTTLTMNDMTKTRKTAQW